MVVDTPPCLSLLNVTKRFGSFTAVDNVTLDVKKGEFLTLLGPSGSGKTTLQRLIGGFEVPERGLIKIDGHVVNLVPAYMRDTATVFQTGALFPHKTVAGNLAYGMRVRGVAKSEIEARIAKALSLVSLDNLQNRYPHELSGGQKQRIALARALVIEPAVLLFDEPLSALDLSLRLQLRTEIKRLHKELGFTAVFVTHDQSEAMALSDRIAVLNKGAVEQIDTPESLFRSPASAFVFRSLGEACCLTLNGHSGGYVGPEGQAVAVELSRPPGKQSFCIYLRPSKLRVGEDGQCCSNRIAGRLAEVEFLGEHRRAHLDVAGQRLFADVHDDFDYPIGAEVTIGWRCEDARIY